MDCTSADSLSRHFEARAAWSAYFALVSVWAVLAIFYGFLKLRYATSNTGIGGLMCATIAVLWIVWLRGFKIVLAGEHFHYRNGLYRSITINLGDISRVRSVSISWRRLGRVIPISRLVIDYGSPLKHIVVNPKPFRSTDLRHIMQTLGDHG
jgi:hypothetical protein